MATDSIQVSAVISASPEELYRAWLDSATHSAMTGGGAKIDPSIGGKFTGWDGYITGTTLELEPGRRIVQSWRTSEFPEGSADSRLTVTLVVDRDGTRVVIDHAEIPAGDGEKYRKGWEDFYFGPMRRHFGTPTAPGRELPLQDAGKGELHHRAAKKAAPKKVAAKKAAPKKVAAKKAAAKKAAPKKVAAKKAAPKKAAAKKAAPKKAAAKKAAPKKKAAVK